MTRFGHKLNYVIKTFVKHTPGQKRSLPTHSPFNLIYGCHNMMIVERYVDNQFVYSDSRAEEQIRWL